jgi:hypothetical protein
MTDITLYLIAKRIGERLRTRLVGFQRGTESRVRCEPILAQKLNGLGSHKPKVAGPFSQKIDLKLPKPGKKVGFVAREALSDPRVFSRQHVIYVPEGDGLILWQGSDQEGWHRGSKPLAPSGGEVSQFKEVVHSFRITAMASKKSWSLEQIRSLINH